MLLDSEEELKRIPDVFTVDGFRGAGDQDAAHGSGDNKDRSGDKLAEESSVRCLCVSSPIALTQAARGLTANNGLEAIDCIPGEERAVFGAWGVEQSPGAPCSTNCPT